MDQPLPEPADNDDTLPTYDFTPVPSRSTRRDGWTAERQRQFITALAAMGSVAYAARAVGMGITSAYALRRRPGAASLAAAWDAALAEGQARAFHTAMDRALNGELVPRTYRGEVVGYVRRTDDRMTIAALRYAGLPEPIAPRAK